MLTRKCYSCNRQMRYREHQQVQTELGQLSNKEYNHIQDTLKTHRPVKGNLKYFDMRGTPHTCRICFTSARNVYKRRKMYKKQKKVVSNLKDAGYEYIAQQGVILRHSGRGSITTGESLAGAKNN